jgi:hypothetical protein
VKEKRSGFGLVVRHLAVTIEDFSPSPLSPEGKENLPLWLRKAPSSSPAGDLFPALPPYKKLEKTAANAVKFIGLTEGDTEWLQRITAARLLQKTLEEESQTNEKLTRLAESGVNRMAANQNPGQR